jgi:nucleoside-diphosphate-sugar epimerase
VINFKTCLVTGGCGFIGSALVKKLVEEKITVHVVDNMSSGVKDRLDGVDCNLIVANFDNQKILQMIKEKKFDTVFHLAAIPSVAFSVENPSLTTEINIASTVRLFEAAIGNVKRIVFSSSAAVYGDKYEHDISSIFGKHPITPYAWQKSAIEDISKIFCNLYDVDIVSLRYFNVYGPGKSENTQYSSVISSWLNCVENNIPLILEGDGTQSRDFVYIDDVVRANIIAANHSEQFKGIAYNVSTGVSTTNNKVLEHFCDYFEGIEVKKAPPRLGDIKLSLGNSSRIKSHLNFSTETCFNEGIVKTFNWHSNKKETK